MLPELMRARPSRFRAYAVSLPLMAVGSIAAHSLAYHAVAPERDERLALLARTGHGYLAYAHLAVAVCVTVTLAGLVAVVVGAMKGRTCSAVPAWPIALVLSLGFAVQEHVERLIASGEIPLDAVLEPTFTVGLLLQFAFALGAAYLARALLASGVVVGRALAGRRRHPARTRSRSKSASSAAPPPRSVLALGHAQRAPPLLPLG